MATRSDGGHNGGHGSRLALITLWWSRGIGIDQVDLSQVSTFEVCRLTWSTSPAYDGRGAIGSQWNVELWPAYYRDWRQRFHSDPMNAIQNRMSLPFMATHQLSYTAMVWWREHPCLDIVGRIYLERRCGLKFDINLGDFLPGNDSQDRLLFIPNSSHWFRKPLLPGARGGWQGVERIAPQMMSCKVSILMRATVGAVSIFVVGSFLQH